MVQGTGGREEEHGEGLLVMVFERGGWKKDNEVEGKIGENEREKDREATRGASNSPTRRVFAVGE